METKVNELLPIGSVVILNNAQKRLMVHGIRQLNKEDGKEYDYIGVLYPEGNMSDEMQFLFNHDDILEVFFRGFEDEEREEFIERLDAFYREQTEQD